MTDNPYRFLVGQAAINPNQIAQIEGSKRDTEITFEQLLDLTDRVASKLAAEGVRPGSAVALGALGKWTWVLTLSLWRLGASAVGASSIGSNFESVSATHLMTQQREVRFSGRVICIDDDWVGHASTFERHGRIEAFTDQNPYPIIALTSGTTGMPKQVAISNELLLRRNQTFSERVLNRHPFIWLPGGSALWPQLMRLRCLTRGLPYCIVRPQPEDYGELLSAIRRFDMNTLFGAPGQIEAFLRTVGDSIRTAKTLKRIYVSGGQVSQSLKDLVIGKFRLQLWSGYAGTESGVISIKELGLNDNPKNLGVPLSNVEVQLVDGDNNPVAPGKTGRIRVKSDQMVEGYLDEPKASAKVFQDGWFYPGDLMRFLPTGELFYEGRMGEVVNILGSKVNPTSMDEYMMTHPNVRDVANFGIEVGGELRFLACAVVLQGAVELKELMEFARDEFGQRSPVMIFAIDSIPRTELNKVNRAQLTAAHSSRIVKLLKESRQNHPGLQS